MDRIRLSRADAFKIGEYLRANAERYSGKPRRIIADMVTSELGREVTLSLVESIITDFQIPIETARSPIMSTAKVDARVTELSERVAELEIEFGGINERLDVLVERLNGVNAPPASPPTSTTIPTWLFDREH